MAQLDPAIISAAQTAMRRWKVPASVSLAQFALESSWGKFVTGPNNFFGIKAGHGEVGVQCPTHEFVKGRMIKTTGFFCAYPSPEAAFEAHAQLLASSPCYSAAQKMCHSPEAYARALTGVYATDPKYGDKLIEIMRESGLEKYDSL